MRTHTSRKHPHDDAPDTAAEFDRLAHLPEGAEREAVRPPAEAVKPRLRRLPERERRILYMRFFRDMTQRSIAEDLGISQMHVSRLISNSCERLRREIMQDAA
ncbi:sigma-70 family RNA polymerase sigma factor [Streptomyces sp. NBC_01794]|uniref:sigma-70 family RNA polymerase sigma factor n=1 Tax=Streptomyces sp. NBC_01794 TaxID=2975942 RepID=UPI00308EB0F3|nr:sigma-70 family RNA polymerase sigma factor [Streptomyces sp. NBC_01794]